MHSAVHSAVHCAVHSAEQYGAVQYCAVQYDAVQCSTVTCHDEGVYISCDDDILLTHLVKPMVRGRGEEWTFRCFTGR